MPIDSFGGLIELQCVYCFLVVYPEEYVKHLETTHPIEAQERQKWLKLFKRSIDEREEINGNN